MKNIISFPIILLLVCSVYSQNLSTLYKKVNSSIVVIKSQQLVVDGIRKDNKTKVKTTDNQGSGVLISKDGLIWTASHVVHSSEKIVVKFNDGDVYDATVLSTNPIADVALIKIEADFELKNKHVAIVGDSDKTQIGEDIFVIGAPLGIEQTLTKGIISGRMSPKALSDDFFPVEFLQTDAAINPGNSGGPMFNMNGEVIGIASFILSQTGGFNGLGFGASSKIARKVLMEQGNFWTGMQSILLTDELANTFNLPQKAGLLVLSVSSKGLANKMDLKGGFIKATIAGKQLIIGGDVILSIAGIQTDSPENLNQIRQKLIMLKKGDSYIVKYLRAGKVLIKAVLKE